MSNSSSNSRSGGMGVADEVVQVASPQGLSLVVTCDLDFERAERVAEALARCDRGPVTLDLTRCQFIDSTGIGVLVDTLRTYQDRGIEVRAVRVRPSVFEVLEIVGAVDVFGRNLFAIEDGTIGRP
ncbi:Sulfate transporter/antisigma-factor antagonist STAS [Thermaerobacter marianensis DSM 12885]|uniref:Sulfate transporter/antisigma-factor antagonist STAS n=2 Tax=Thermaerobacter marianensis TaxID=73919 RepID=E6SI34_THEM7|nr:Sulfate transporter/antisigma-factor antagonist STAS [Thermaerobacter marianensis DSM 12885]